MSVMTTLRARWVALCGALALMCTLMACQSDGDKKAGAEAPSAEAPAAEGGEEGAAAEPAAAAAQKKEGQPKADPPPDGMKVATFAGGCFWCMEPPFEEIDGVQAVLSGYTGGEEARPTYEQVSSGQTGHTEAVRVVYDPQKVDYRTLVETYWRSMDPMDGGGQFADRGSQYRPAIFTHSDEQMKTAKESEEALSASGRFDEPIVVPIEPAQTFWIAEEYHQDYYKKNPIRYERYAVGSGRKPFLKETWGTE